MYCVAVQNKFKVLGVAEEVDQQWVKFKEAAVEQIPKAERKTKEKWRTEDILDLIEKRRQIKNNREIYETLHKEIRKL